MDKYINMIIPSKPKKVFEDGNTARYEISGLYPGYGNTLGSSLRRMLLSSISGAAIVSVKIKGVEHEFSVIDGLKEDIITMLLNIKNVRLMAKTDIQSEIIKIKKKGKGKITGKDIETPTQLEVVNKDIYIAEITDDKTEIDIEAEVQLGIGYRSREEGMIGETEKGKIILDAIFSPVKRSSYEVSNMRVGGRTDFNKTEILIETDGTITPDEALKKALTTIQSQFSAMLNFDGEDVVNTKKMETKQEEDNTSVSIKDMNLSDDACAVLEKNDIKTVTNILDIGIVGIKKLDDMTSETAEEIIKAFQEKGIILKSK